MVEIDFARLYSDTILRKIVLKIVADKKKKSRAQKVAMETAETASQVRTMRHWRAVADSEFYYSEISEGYKRMKQLDKLTGWSKNLHQDRFRFMDEKYKDILNEYLQDFSERGHQNDQD